MSVEAYTCFSIVCYENGYIVHDTDSKDCVVVDPGFTWKNFSGFIEKNGLNAPLAALLTHGHADHLGGLNELKELFPEMKVVISELEAERLTNPARNLSSLFGNPLTFGEADFLLTEKQQRLEFGSLLFDAYFTPGHAAGHYIFALPQTSPLVVLTGDLIFEGSIGRTDYYDGNMTAIVDSITSIVYHFPDDTILLSGHGNATSVGVEAKTNPFVRRV
ncbi:MAG: MBL fold metallo-hydrolase [Planctomycetia bacterium]|nr:MBL fold metallo-hydrolase [Planctomycetia bacterium]